MKKIGMIVLWGALVLSAPAQAEWVDLSGRLDETNIHALALDPGDSRVLYAASDRRLYKTQDQGKSWKRVLAIRGSESRIHFVYVDPRDRQTLYVASDRGIQVSRDAGKKFEYLYRGMGDRGKTVHSLAADFGDTQAVWAGTSDGLVRILPDPKNIRFIEGLPKENIYSINADEQHPGRLWVTTSKGIYKSEDSGVHWLNVRGATHVSEDPADTGSLSQFNIEEISFTPVFSNIVRFAKDDTLYAASSAGILRGEKGGESWAVQDGAGLPAQKVRYLTRSSEALYAATDQGAFRWDEKNGLKDISNGLVSKEVRMLAFDPASGDLFAATKKGVFRYPKPEFKTPVSPREVTGGLPEARDILKHFESEPTIGQVQNAAIRYAEVHPDKIRAWREAAMRKALLPTLSVTSDRGVDHNVDIDRGGTNDPDKFITGPVETNTDWHMAISWDLGEIVWNNDQTSIDTRSKLMVELRDDILNEVTHFYFERRRLQAEMFMAPAKELPLQVERQLKLEELTASIDALTGGYLSQALSLAGESGVRLEVAHG